MPLELLPLPLLKWTDFPLDLPYPDAIFNNPPDPYLDCSEDTNISPPSLNDIDYPDIMNVDLPLLSLDDPTSKSIFLPVPD